MRSTLAFINSEYGIERQALSNKMIFVMTAKVFFRPERSSTINERTSQFIQIPMGRKKVVSHVFVGVVMFPTEWAAVFPLD